jgi:hypothetical protein
MADFPININANSKENVSNKKTTLTDNSDTFYPTQKAVKTAVDAKLNTPTGTTAQYLRGDGSLETFPTIPDVTGLQSKAVVVSANQTAVNDGNYTVVANATFTDPSPVEGKGYRVFVRNGTATINSVAYTEGTTILRLFHSGAWVSYLGGGSQDLQQVTNLGSTTTETILVLDNPSSTNYLSIISNSAVEVVNNITLEQSGLLADKIQIVKFESSIGRGGDFKISNVTSPNFVTLEFPNKPTGSYTIATTADIPDTSDFVEKSDFTSHSILAKQSGASDPVAVSIGNNEILGRKSGGGSNIEGLSVSEVKSLLGYTASDVGAVATNSAITGATKTKITYDAKGLVTSGADATTADIADSSNKRYVTDAQLTVIGNTSGTNTGDETQASILSKLGFFVNNRTTDTTAVTGTTTETIIDSVLIPANTYSASGGILRLYNSKFSKTGTAGTLRIKIYVGPNAGNLTGATLLADSGSLASTIVYSEMLRTFTVGSSTLKGIGSGVVSLTDVVSSNSARSSIAWNPAIDNYIHYTVINGSSADSTVMIGNSVKNF